MKELLKPYMGIIKIVGGIIIIAIICYGVYRLYLYIRDKIALAKDPSQNTTIDPIDLTHGSGNNGTTPTSQPAYADFANQIETALSGFGTDEDAVYEVFNQMQSAADLNMLAKAFGIRDGENMKAWLLGDLNDEEMRPIRDQYSLYGLTF